MTDGDERGTGRGGMLLAGFVVLHVLCCGATLLGGAGLVAAAGGLLGQPLLVAAGVALLASAVVVGARRARRARRSACAVRPASGPEAAARQDRTTV